MTTVIARTMMSSTPGMMSTPYVSATGTTSLNLRHLAANLVDLIFMIKNSALGLHVAARDIDFETLTQWRDQDFLDRGRYIALG